MARPRPAAPLLAALLLAACGAGPDEGPAVDLGEKAQAETRAGQVADRFAEALMKELAAALEEGGPAGAVEVCGEVAARVEAETSAAEGVTIRRTSLRIRNPVNEPDGVEREILEGWAAGEAPASVSRVVAGPDGPLLRWMRPIRVASSCLPCHGAEEIPEEVRANLYQRYPQDRATGFREGDLRGAFSVRIPLQPAGK